MRVRHRGQRPHSAMPLVIRSGGPTGNVALDDHDVIDISIYAFRVISGSLQSSTTGFQAQSWFAGSLLAMQRRCQFCRKDSRCNVLRNFFTPLKEIPWPPWSAIALIHIRIHEGSVNPRGRLPDISSRLYHVSESSCSS